MNSSVNEIQSRGRLQPPPFCAKKRKNENAKTGKNTSLPQEVGKNNRARMLCKKNDQQQDMTTHTMRAAQSAPSTGTAITYICLPADTYQAMQSDIAELKSYMLRHPQKNTGKESPEYVSPKDLERITNYTHSTLARHIKAAQAAGVQIIGQPGKHRVHLQQFLAYMERLQTPAAPQNLTPKTYKRR